MGGNGLSVGIMPYTTDEEMVSCGDDNGVYVIEGWKVVDRVYPWEDFEEKEGYDLDAMLLDIDASQPEDQRLGEFLRAKEVPVSDVRVGDRIWLSTFRGWESGKVVGIGDGVVNGRDVSGIPYTDIYASCMDPRDNRNNYPDGETVWVSR